MTLGYVGLRYIELSISSPICNSSGALVAVLCLCTGALSDYNGPQKAVILCAVGLVCLGVVGLGVVEAREDDDLRRRRQEHANRKYAKSWLAICLPVAYCLLDAAGTFADSLVLERLNEDSANVAYELTFLAAGIGNIHGVYPANWKGLDFEALDRIHKATNNIPLVLSLIHI